VKAGRAARFPGGLTWRRSEAPAWRSVAPTWRAHGGCGGGRRGVCGGEMPELGFSGR
jgi:hypothetical protein